MASVSKFLGKLRTAWRLPFREWLWLLMMYPLSGLVRVGVTLLPFRWWAPWLGKEIGARELSPLASAEQERIAWRIGRLCALAARYTPWETKCLVQAAIVRIWLGYYQIPYLLQIGVMKAPEREGGGIKAHAWVRVGRYAVCGGEGHLAFTALSGYVDPRLFDGRAEAVAGSGP